MERKETELHNLCDYIFLLVVGKTLSDAKTNEIRKDNTNDRDARIASLEEIIDQHKYGDKHLDAVTEIGKLFGLNTGRKSTNCTLSVKYYRYPEKPMHWRNINMFTTLYDACHIMLGCLHGLSGNDEFYCEAVIFLNGKRMPGISNKKESGFEDGRLHLKLL